MEYTAKQIQAAYIEGFLNGQDNNNLPFKYPPLSISFVESETRLTLEDTDPIPDIQRELVKAWRDMPYKDRLEMGSPPFEDVEVAPYLDATVKPWQ